jgi:hypothetical protein
MSSTAVDDARGHGHAGDVSFTPNVVHEPAQMPSSLPTAHSILATPLSRSASPAVSSSPDTSPHQVSKPILDHVEVANIGADKPRLAVHDDGHMEIVNASAAVQRAALGGSDAEAAAHAHAHAGVPDVLLAHAHASNVRAPDVQTHSANQRHDAVRPPQVRSHKHKYTSC